MKMYRKQENPVWPAEVTATITVVSPHRGKFGDPMVYRLVGDTMDAKVLTPGKEYKTQAACIRAAQKIGWVVDQADNATKRLRQVRDALNKCKNQDVIEQIGNILNV